MTCLLFSTLPVGMFDPTPYAPGPAAQTEGLTHKHVHTHPHTHTHTHTRPHTHTHLHTHTHTHAHTHTLTYTRTHTHTHTHTHTQDCCTELEARGAGAPHAQTRTDKMEQVSRDVPRTSYRIQGELFGCAMGEQIQPNIRQKQVS